MVLSQINEKWLLTSHVVNKSFMSFKIHLKSFNVIPEASQSPASNTLGKMSDESITSQEESDHLSFCPFLFGERDTSES